MTRAIVTCVQSGDADELPTGAAASGKQSLSFALTKFDPGADPALAPGRHTTDSHTYVSSVQEYYHQTLRNGSSARRTRDCKRFLDVLQHALCGPRQHRADGQVRQVPLGRQRLQLRLQACAGLCAG